MNNIIPIQTTEKEFYYNYLRILTPVVNKICQLLSGDICYLRNADIVVLANLIYHYNHTPGTAKEKNKYLFDFEMTNKICEDARLSLYNYTNTTCRLRKFGVIQGKMLERTLHPVFQNVIPTKKGYSLTINFVFPDDKS